MNIESNYELLIQKLDQFIRKFYINKLLRGSIYAFSFILAFFIVSNLLEYYLFLSPSFRKILFFGFTGSSLFAITGLIILPLIHYFRLGKIISHERAAQIIGTHFEEVQDRLLNILQLKKLSADSSNAELINASINQKIESLKPIPFSRAINLNRNRKYLRYLVVPASVLLFLVIAAPNIIKDGTNRLIHNNESFEKKAPFSFLLENKTLEVVQGEDLSLSLKMDGSVLPQDVYVEFDGYSYKMIKESNSEFSFTFINVQQDRNFSFGANGFNSEDYEIKVLPKPMIVGFTAEIDYPAYTGKEDETLKNIGDLQLLQGSKVIWKFNVQNTDNLLMSFSDSVYDANRQGENSFTVSKQFMQDDAYTLKVLNNKVKHADSISYSVNVVPDKYPAINVEQHVDSTNNDYLYFLGDANDDYGLRKLTFNYTIVPEEGKESELLSEEISMVKGSTLLPFNHFWDLTKVELLPGDKINYYFEVWDNDGVNGSKSSRSALMTYELPTAEEFEEQSDQTNEEIQQDLKKQIEESQKLQEQIEKMKDDLMQKKNMDWNDKKAMEELIEQQKEMQKQLEEMSKKFEENLNQQEEFKKVSEQLKEKQEDMQKMFEELPKEMQELMEKIQELMKEMEKEGTMEKLEKIEMTQEQMEMQMERMEELYKQLLFEQKTEDLKNKLEELAKAQEELSEKTEEGKENQDSLKAEQEKLNEKFDEAAKEMEELKEMKKEMGGMEEEFSRAEDAEKSAQEKMDNASEELAKKKNGKASESQKGAAGDMKKMADELGAMMAGMQMEQMEMDMKALRQLLENLVELSFDQEDVMEEIQLTDINNPRYIELIQDQHKLKGDAEMVKDSLVALSKRVFQLESFILEKISDINHNMEGSITNLEDRKVDKGTVNQQYVMTGLNDLALMLSEVMEQMQQQMAMKIPGNQTCENPGGSGKPKPSMGESQKKLNGKMKGMSEKMQKGETPGQQGMSKELAEMAAQQAAIRKELEKLGQQEMGKEGGISKELQELQEEMAKTEKELVNKNFSTETVIRQQEILTRLLEAENSIRQREYDQERKSTSAEEIVHDNLPSLDEYLKKREAEIQIYKTVPLSLKPFYKDLVEKYFKSLPIAQ